MIILHGIIVFFQVVAMTVALSLLGAAALAYGVFASTFSRRISREPSW